MGLAPRERRRLARLRRRRERGPTTSLADLGFYWRECDLCGRPCQQEVCDRCWQTVIEPRASKAMERMKRRWLEAGLPWPED